MNWSEENEANEDCPYNHVRLETPIGLISIEWKGWKEIKDYSIEIDNVYIGNAYTLEDAKVQAENFLIEKSNELLIFLNK